MTYRELRLKAKLLGIKYATRDPGTGKVAWLDKAALIEKIALAKPGPDLPGIEDGPTATPKDTPGQQKPGQLEAVFQSMIDSRLMDKIADLETRVTKQSEAGPSYHRIEIKLPGKDPKKVTGSHKAFERIAKLASARQNIMMVGPTGSGKTELARQVATALDMPFSELSCSAGTSESQLQGWLLPVGDSGRFSYVPAPFVETYQNGGVFLLDEIDSADPNLLTIINSALANGHFTIPQKIDGGSSVTRHPDFVCIACANTYGHGADRLYVGRNQLDASTLERFRAGTVFIGYDPGIEIANIHPEIYAWGLGVRSKIETHKLRRIMSTRFMIDSTKLFEIDKTEFSLDSIKSTYFQDWSKDERAKL